MSDCVMTTLEKYEISMEEIKEENKKKMIKSSINRCDLNHRCAYI